MLQLSHADYRAPLVAQLTNGTENLSRTAQPREARTIVTPELAEVFDSPEPNGASDKPAR